MSPRFVLVAREYLLIRNRERQAMLAVLRQALVPFRGFTSGNPEWVDKARALVEPGERS
jgi:hypothetical protein